MMDLEPLNEKLDNDNDNCPTAAKSPGGRHRLIAVLIATVVIAGGVVISTNAINSYYDGGSPNAETSVAGDMAEVSNGDHPTIVTADLAVTGLLSRASNPSIDPQAVEPADDAAWWVQVFSMRIQTNTTAAWSSLQKTNQDLLDGLEMHVQLAELSSGTFYRVQAGPLADRASAASLCDTLKTRRQDCLIVAR